MEETNRDAGRNEMSTKLLPHADITVTDDELKTVRRQVGSGRTDLAGFAAVMSDGDVRPLAPEFSSLIEKVVNALATNGSVSIGTLPEELTSNTAADVIGVSRPTLLKFAKAGEISAFKVGSHTRFRRDDVLKFRAKREQDRRQAITELLDLEDQLDSFD